MFPPTLEYIQLQLVSGSVVVTYCGFNLPFPDDQ